MGTFNKNGAAAHLIWLMILSSARCGGSGTGGDGETEADMTVEPDSSDGAEAPDALLSDGRTGYKLLGTPSVGVEQMIRWIADWQLRGGPVLGKPTHVHTRDGNC